MGASKCFGDDTHASASCRAISGRKRLADHLSVTPSRAGWPEMTYVEDEGDGDMGHVNG